MEYPFIERDIAWLYFNHRVLQEAANPDVPLYERIKFLAIYSSNLDEFFRVRVASLRSFRKLKKKTRREIMDSKPKKVLQEIKRLVRQQQQQFGKIFRAEILPELARQGIYLWKETQYDENQRQFARQYFDEKIKALIQVHWLDKQTELAFLENQGIYFVVSLKGSPEKLALVNIPSKQLPRFIRIPSSEKSTSFYISYLDDILRSNIDRLFPDDVVEGVYSVKISRDAELYIEDEFEGNLVEKIRNRLSERKVGLPTRFLYDSLMPDELITRMREIFKLNKYDLIPGARYHNFNDFFGFPDPSNNPALHDEPLPPLPHPILEKADSILEVMNEQDVLLNFPYQKYDYIPQMIREAAQRPSVKMIKITLYRVAEKSEVGFALLEALEQEKEVVVFIEAKARFDEASNLKWGEKLSKAGARVLYSYPAIKVHTKLLMITEQEEGNTHHFAYIGTGNFNEKTAKLYADHALLTTDKRLTSEITQVFDLLERKIIMPKTKHMLVSPFTTRSGFEDLIDNEIKLAKKGKDAYMVLKMNSLEDKGMITKLYEASQAGVEIRLIVRGICSLVPGIEGISENIKVISIIDRFLEHARIYIFGNNGDEKMYIASADWMSRNLDSRVEVVAPIYDKTVYQELRQVVALQWRDNVKARRITPRNHNPYRKYEAGQKEVRSQLATYNYFRSILPETIASELTAKSE